MKEIIDFLFEVGMLKKTPRSGFQFLGSGNESVAEHILRVVFIGYTLGKLVRGVNEIKLLKMCMLHDVTESRTGDLNYVNKKYVISKEEDALEDLSRELPFGKEIKSLIEEFNEGKTLEAKLANDADQLELILQLKECQDLGNKYASEWLPFVLKRLKTNIAQEMAKEILNTDSTHWWFKDKSDWWINAGEKRFKS